MSFERSFGAPRATWPALALFTIVVASGAYLALSIHLMHWNVNPKGISPVALKLPTWDFTNLWMGGRLALDGRLDEILPAEAYRAALTAALGPMPHSSEWSYPPNLLLVAAPVGSLPLEVAYWLWTTTGLAVLAFTLRRGGLSPMLCAAVLLSPAVAINALLGQNAAFTVALTIGGLMSARTRPVLAGLCFGVLTMKPHLGVLIPVCLVAAGCWRAIGWSAFFSTLIAAATTAAFGLDVWRMFLTETQPLMRSILEAPYGQPYHANGATVFLLFRSIGADVTTAYAVQAVAALAAAVTAWRLWRRPTAEPLLRAAATSLLAVLASPYAWSYDLVASAVVVAILITRTGGACAVGLAVSWLWPLYNQMVVRQFYPIMPIVIGVLAWLACRHILGAGAAPTSPPPRTGPALDRADRGVAQAQAS